MSTPCTKPRSAGIFIPQSKDVFFGMKTKPPNPVITDFTFKPSQSDRIECIFLMDEELEAEELAEELRREGKEKASK